MPKKVFIFVFVINVLLLAACSNSTAPGQGLDERRGVISRGQAERQLLERTLQFEAADTGAAVTVRLLHAPLPSYPAKLRETGIHGTVRIKFLVEEDGTVSNPQVLGAPPASLAAASINVLLKWRFVPISIEGKSVRIQLIQTFTYQIDG